MKRTRRPLILLPLLLLAPLMWLKQKRDNNTAVILARYQQGADFSFSNTVISHSRDNWNTSSYDNLELYATYFYDGNTKTTMSTQVDGAGWVSNSKLINGGPITGTPHPRLTFAQMQQLRSQIAKLPKNDLPALRNELLIVTFKRAKTHEMRLYNRTDPPPQIKRIYEITGAPLR